MNLAQQSVDAVILAGGINTVPLYPGYEPGMKALIEIAGRPSIGYVVDALRGCGYVRRIGIVGSETELLSFVGNVVEAFAPAGDSLLGSILQAWTVFPDASRILTTVADLPLLKSNMIDAFLKSCATTPTRHPENAFIAVVPKEDFTGLTAHAHKDMSAFQDITVCHGNLLLADSRIGHNAKAMARINAVYATRKNPVKNALAFGIGLGLTYIFGVHIFHCVTLAGMAERASRRFGFGIVPVLCHHPEVALDIDEAEDYQLVQEYLRVRDATDS